MLESITLNSVVTASVLAILAGLIRNVTGWSENALKDGVITPYEWRELAATIGTYIATINVMSIGLDPEIATTVMVALDMIRSALKGIAK